MRWGLVPSWSKEVKGPPLINARAEGIDTKPSFRNAIRQRRCLIPADGFYEWTGPAKKRHPYDFRLHGKKPFAFAGLWERWHGGDDQPLESCTIITTAANDVVRPYHDRMPVMLPKTAWEQWLDPELRDADKVTPLLQPYPAGEMEAAQVSDHANNARNDDPQCLEPASMFGEQG
jgi:putative SOS response-associated peptidase YedK